MKENPRDEKYQKIRSWKKKLMCKTGISSIGNMKTHPRQSFANMEDYKN
jgi:hypothetical protein